MSSRLTPRGIWEDMTRADRVVSVLVLAIAGLGSLGFRGGEGPAVAVVSVDGAPVAELPLSLPGTFPVEGLRGPVEVTVADGEVRVTDAPCPQHLCMAMGGKSRAGQLIACVPSGVVVRIVGGDADADVPDSVTR